MKRNFAEHLNEKVMYGDGAFGTYLFEKGINLAKNTDLLNISDPDLVYSIHEEYIRAGSELIETNTFGANRFKMLKVGREQRVREINLKGAELACRATGNEIFVAGSIGPTGVKFPLESDETEFGTVQEAFAEQMTALLEGGVDLFILETFTYLDELLLAIETAKRIAPDIPIVAQMVYPFQGRTAIGLDALTCGRTTAAAGATVVGTNCGRGVKAMLSAVERLSPLKDEVFLSAFPNAGLPEVIEHRMVYSTPPSYMAEKVAEMVKLGVRLIGGCCGTTLDHIREFRKYLRLKRHKAIPVVAAVEKSSDLPEDRKDSIGRDGMIESLKSDRIPVLVEVDPPRHLDIEGILTGARALVEAGVDAITLAEHPLAVLRADNLSLAHMIREKTGVRTVLHLTCRDRDILGLQAQIMGAHVLGLEAILAVTGDPATSTDQPGVSGVFDVRSFGLVQMISQFNCGLNMAGASMKKQTNFSIGVAFSYRPVNPDLQISRLERKADLGAHFVMTQPIFDRDAVEAMMEQTQHLNLLIFMGIFPLISARNADFLHNKIPGISIPREVREHLWKYEKVEDQRKVALDLTRKLIADITPFADGLYLISPNKWEIPLTLVKEVRASGY
ncbi:MAG: bifunctional homocysteine S-methyltransferase/methylenetetrahydrofolate reductase [Deltaproteobacteria bacterium]|nr:bifunctional homocysteine S-methyltransferase/methylenetetrahydrofolate reductase [Deltaproteobacteria bacterium]MDL1961190.1 bifunctional homocysteine S-methyltransferase/methylenetetrahydrofolate reductase [Deltaproteobacteria bacterium]